jgi:hypothetical protein
VLRCRRGDDVSGPRVAIDGVDPPCLTDDLGEGNCDVPTTCADVDTLPTPGDPEAFERDGERATVDVVPERSEDRCALRWI